MGLTKEGSGVLSTVGRHLAFLDSVLVAEALSRSTFDLNELRKPGTTIFFEVGSEFLDSQRGYIRAVISAVIKATAQFSERDGEVLLVIDEASVINGLSAAEECLVRLRSAGGRMLLVYQSDSQIKAAFKDKPTLIYDNCSTQIYLGASSYETAERISKQLGDATIVIESASSNSSRSGQQGGQGGVQVSHGSGRNLSEISRALLRPDEVLQLPSDYLIAFVKDVRPILARRIRWFDDVLFGTAKGKKGMHWLGWVLLAIGTGLFIAMIRDFTKGR